MNLPQNYENRMKALLGEDFNDYKNSLEDKPIRAFRVNTDKISLEDFEKICDFPHEKIPYLENGFYFDLDKIGNHPFHHAGMIYVQEPAAMSPAECIDISPDWCVLDMCAAPGGKSTQIKNKLGENGVLLSNEIIPSRCKILAGNIERLGLDNTIVTCMDTNKLAKLFPKTFDMIMLDAPCSGEGMFRKEPVALSEWSEENVRVCAERQKAILENAFKCVKNGGYIVYSTCTFSLEENEKVIDEFLSTHTDFELLPVKSKIKEISSDGICFDGCKHNLNLARRFYPHKVKGEGQFAAVLHSTSNAPNPTVKKLSYKEPDKIVKDFLSDTLTQFNLNDVTLKKETPIILSSHFDTKNATVFLSGITIGEIKKNYILPHHQFFMAMGKYFKRKIELDLKSDLLNKYLHGEEIDVNCENGWAVVTVCGQSIGGVKVVSGKAKNHYPKGLRIK